MRRRLEVPTLAPCGKFSKVLYFGLTSASPQSKRLVIVVKDNPVGNTVGISFKLCTAKSTRFSNIATSSSFVNNPLPQGAKVGTSSLRRKAQLLKARPDLDIHSLRGNVNTRLRKLEEENFDAIVLAVAGLKRLGFGDKITQIIPREICLPAVGQGALAIETREDDEEIKQMLEFLHDDKTADATKAERSFLARVEGGCQVPVGVYAQVEDDDNLSVEAVIGSIDGKCIIRDKIIGSRANAKTLGKDLAEKLLANGGLKIMQSLGLCCPDENAQ